MSGVGWFALGAVAATIIMTRVRPANESNCCQRVAFGARDKIAGFAGPLDGAVSGALDTLGITKHIPSILDDFGVPLDA
jgi:hypothetical protein